MGMFSGMHWVIVLLIVVILFGPGRIPNLMSDLGKGIRNFKKNLHEEDDAKKKRKTTKITKLKKLDKDK